MPHLAINNIEFSYKDNKVLNNISFEVNPAELVCLVGPSGCGKSTLLRVIAGLEKNQLGNIKIDGKTITDIDTRYRNIGMVFQHPSLFPHLSVYDNIAFGIRKCSKKQKAEICAKMLKLVGLNDLAKSYPHQLSGGQHQRVSIARALAPSPKIMLLDEPFANLDHALRCDIREEVISILKQVDVPTIMVTHSPEEALIMADKMVLLNKKGKIHQIGEPDIIHNDPVDLESAEFFGSVNKIKGRIKGKKIISEIGSLDKETYAQELQENDDVLIVTRPEGLKLARPEEECTKVIIKSVRHTGAGWLIRAITENGGDIIYHHIYGSSPKRGETVCITFKDPHIFVFKNRT